ncbi:hypothetical protein EV361DRAFT_865913 [Lentinula raphanica]|nr:hypothetical protein EV361DRAFT_865913 [Lentinula raphanica]
MAKQQDHETAKQQDMARQRNGKTAKRKTTKRKTMKRRDGETRDSESARQQNSKKTDARSSTRTMMNQDRQLNNISLLYAIRLLKEPADAQPLLRQGSAGSLKASLLKPDTNPASTRLQKTRHPEMSGTRYPGSRVRVWPGLGSGWLHEHPTRPETNTMQHNL